MVDISREEQAQRSLWGEVEALGAGCARLLRVLGSGHFARATNNHLGLLERIPGGFSLGGYWHIPEPVDSPQMAGRWLLNRYPPGCAKLYVYSDRVEVAGARGWVAVAVEGPVGASDASGDGLFEVLADRLGAAEKAAHDARRIMPKGQFGWLRPLLLEGSAITGEGRVVCYDPVAETMVEDASMSAAWRAVLQDPSDSGRIDQLLNLVRPVIDELLDLALNLEEVTMSEEAEARHDNDRP